MVYYMYSRVQNFHKWPILVWKKFSTNILWYSYSLCTATVDLCKKLFFFMGYNSFTKYYYPMNQHYTVYLWHVDTATHTPQLLNIHRVTYTGCVCELCSAESAREIENTDFLCVHSLEPCGQGTKVTHAWMKRTESVAVVKELAALLCVILMSPSIR